MKKLFSFGLKFSVLSEMINLGCIGRWHSTWYWPVVRHVNTGEHCYNNHHVTLSIVDLDTCQHSLVDTYIPASSLQWCIVSQHQCLEQHFRTPHWSIQWNRSTEQYSSETRHQLINNISLIINVEIFSPSMIYDLEYLMISPWCWDPRCCCQCRVDQWHWQVLPTNQCEPGIINSYEVFRELW